MSGITTTTPCRWAGSNHPRLLRSHLRDCELSTCPGCQPCGERHCGLCGKEHVTVEGRGTDQTCAACIGVVRTAIAGIVRLSRLLIFEAVVAGVDSEAANLAGPSLSTPDQFEAWGHRFLSATLGRIPAIEVTDERHPLWVLGTWEMLVREHYDQPDEHRITITAAAAYLGGHLSRLAHDEDFAFEELARDVRGCLGHLEDVLHEGEREERGAPCPMCGAAYLVKDYGTKAEDEVRWRCPRKTCATWYTEADYRSKVDAVYALASDRLTAAQIHATYRIKPATLRKWAERGLVAKLGVNGQRQQLYDVAAALALRDRPDTPMTA